MLTLWLIFAPVALALTLAQAIFLVPRLPEPAEGPELGKTTYASLPSRGRLGILAALSLAAQAATAVAPAEQRGLWLVLGSSVLTLIWVDGLTTWLPTVFARICLAQLVIATAVGAVWSDDPTRLLLRAVIGAATAWLLWWLIWRLTRGGVGYGDVRLAPLLGLVTGASGLDVWMAALLGGALSGVVWGLVRHRRRRPAPGTRTGFAYGPALWTGPYLAVIWMWLLGGR